MNIYDEEITKALEDQNPPLEEPAPDKLSPLNQPVTDPENDHPPAPEDSYQDDFNHRNLSDDAPQQDLHQNNPESHSAAFEIPKEQAQVAADSLISGFDNCLEISGGFFVRIKKLPEFYDFDQIIESIDDQNGRNINHVKLSEQEKDQLKPLVTAVIQKRAKKLTPEQQLLGVLTTILAKKVQVIVQIKQENNILLEKIQQSIHQHSTADDHPQKSPEPGNEDSTESNQEDKPPEEEVVEVTYHGQDE